MDSFTENIKDALSLQDKEKLEKVYQLNYPRYIKWSAYFVDFLDRQIEKNNPHAFVFKAHTYLVEHDSEKTIESFSKASSMGVAHATVMLGKLFFFGMDGIDRDYKRAMDWFLKAAKQGSHSAAYIIAGMYARGMGVEKNKEMSLKWYLKAFELGDTRSAYNVAVHYKDNGNNTDALEWYRKAAEYGSRGAMRNMGVIYMEGQNFKKALSWLTKASQLGSASAKQDLKALFNQYSDQMVDILCESKNKTKKLKRKLVDLEQENLELKLRPPTKGGELYMDAKKRFEKTNKKIKF